MIPMSKARAQGGRKPIGAQPPQAQTFDFPAPTQGWFDNQGTAAEIGLSVAENVFVTERGIRLRGGYVSTANVGAPILSMFTYSTASLDKVFAASEHAIYEVSQYVDGGGVYTPVTNRRSGHYSTAQFTTVGGQFLFAANGRDPLLRFDGRDWTDDTGIEGVDARAFSHVWTHKNRLWFIERGTNRAWYLPVDSIAGEALDLSLDGVFQDGAPLLFGATVSQDSGAGMDDRLVLVSASGELALFEGSNPASAADWALVGVYQMDPPLGPNGHIKAGGDLLIATTGGLVAVSAVISKDPAALAATAASMPIRNAWTKEAQKTSALQPWSVIKWAEQNMVFVCIPGADDCFVANATTGAWSKFVGWGANCATTANGVLYFGTDTGDVFEAERSGSDNGAPYVCRFEIAPNSMGANGLFKAASQARAVFFASTEFTPQLAVAADYKQGFRTPPQAAVVTPPSDALWDSARWDQDVFDDDDDQERETVVTGWRSIGKSGYVLAPQVQVTCNSPVKPDVEFMSLRLAYTIGGIAS